MRHFIALLCTCSCAFSPLAAHMIEIIDVPTAEVVDYGIGDISVKLYSAGGVITRIVFAPFNRLNFGGSLDIERMIGKENPLLRDPQFYFKWRLFDGTRYFPAVALGYDGQGYEYSDVLGEYGQPAKGLFMACTLNIVAENLFLGFGLNVAKYKEERNKPFLFIGGRLSIEEIVRILIEFENLGDEQTHQLNCGISFLLADYFNLDLVFKKIIAKDTVIDRQIKISYLYKFF